MAPIRQLADVVIDTTKFNVHELRQFIIDRFQKPGPPSADGFRRQLRISLRNSRRCRPGFRRALSAESALRSAPAPLQRQRSARRALHSLVSADGRISAAHRKPAGIFDPALHSRRQKLSDDRASAAPAAGTARSCWRRRFGAPCSARVTRPRSCIAIWTRPLPDLAVALVLRLRLARFRGDA